VGLREHHVPGDPVPHLAGVALVSSLKSLTKNPSRRSVHARHSILFS
jgi:hypothetical protein